MVYKTCALWYGLHSHLRRPYLVPQLCDSRNVFAVWEKAQPGSEHDAQITLSLAGLTIITEVLTTLTLNLVAKRLDFW